MYNLNLPDSSEMRVEEKNGESIVTIPQKKESIFRFFVGGFTIFWLGGWSMGLFFAIKHLMNNWANAGGAFIMFWLIGWILGGVFAIYMLFVIFRKPIPERWRLKRDELSIDTGRPPSIPNLSDVDFSDIRNFLPKKREKFTLNLDEIKSLRLIEGSRNRLTIDKGVKRVDLAKGATEVEREWLFNYLKSFYGLK